MDRGLPRNTWHTSSIDSIAQTRRAPQPRAAPVSAWRSHGPWSRRKVVRLGLRAPPVKARRSLCACPRLPLLEGAFAPPPTGAVECDRPLSQQCPTSRALGISRAKSSKIKTPSSNESPTSNLQPPELATPLRVAPCCDRGPAFARQLRRG